MADSGWGSIIASVLPGAMAGIQGDGASQAAFMEGWRAAAQRHEERKRRKQLETLALEDRNLAQQERQRLIERQQTADTYAAADRTRRQALEGLQIPGTLAELGATADTPQDAQRLIEAAMPNLMNAFGQESMAFGQPAVEIAQRTITGRQKAEVRRFLEDVIGSQHVAANPDADPELTEGLIPPRIQQLIGKSSARLSEIQRWAEAPVGRPARKPSEDVSLQRQDMLVGGKLTPVNFNPKTGTYTDQAGNPVTVDSVPPKASGDGGLNAYQAAVHTERLAKAWNDANASGREMRRQLGLMETGLRRFREGDKNGGSQAVLVTFQKILDPTSVVRESEYARSAQGISMLGRIQGYIERLEAGGAGVPDAELAGMVETARQMLAEMSDYTSNQRSRIEAAARKYEIDPILIFGAESARSPVPSGRPSDALPPMAPVSSRGATRAPGTQSAGPSGGRMPAAKLRERRKFGDELREWNGSRWVLVTPTKQ